MKKNVVTVTRKGNVQAKPAGLVSLITEVRGLIQSARHAAASTVNTLQVLTNFEIGRRIVNHEQQGEKRAKYGAELLKALSSRLTEEFGKGFSVSNLQLMRKFFLENQIRIQQQPAVKSAISEQALRKSPFTLSWTHYVTLLTIKAPAERRFYEIEAAKEGWSVPELKRQKASALYHRLALGRDKAGVKRLAEKGQIITQSEDLLKDPYVLEFLGLDEKAGYSESDLESAIITHLETFLLELGKGFLFEARQKRFTFDGDHYFLDSSSTTDSCAAIWSSISSSTSSPTRTSGRCRCMSITTTAT